MRFNAKLQTRLAAIAAVAGLAAGSSFVRGSYTYSTAITASSIAGSGGTIINTPGTGATITTTGGTVVTLSDIPMSGTFVVPSTSSINIGKISVSTTDASPDSFSVPYTDLLVITNSTGGMDSFSISGTLTFSGIEFVGGSSAGIVSNQYAATTLGPKTIGGNPFTVSMGDGSVNQLFGPPTVNNPNAAGSLGAIVTAAVPEPIALPLIAGISCFGLLRRRRTATCR